MNDQRVGALDRPEQQGQRQARHDEYEEPRGRLPEPPRPHRRPAGVVENVIAVERARLRGQRDQLRFQGAQAGVPGLVGHGTPNLSRKADNPATYHRWAVLAEVPVRTATCSNVNPPQMWATITSRWTNG